MKPYIGSTRKAFALIAAIYFVFSNMVIAADYPTEPNKETNGGFKLFHLSRGYSKGFTEDPKSISRDGLLRWDLPTPQLIFTSRAYNNAIYSYPQPDHNIVSKDPVIVYVDKAYGQAIYSYPNNVGKGIIIGWPQEVH